MKLLTKNTIALLIATFITFSAGGIIFYYQLKNIMNEEARETLGIRKSGILNYIKSNNELPKQFSVDEPITFKKTNEPCSENFLENEIYNGEIGETLPYIQLEFNTKLDDQNYKCTISKSLLEADDLIETILNSLSIIIALIIAVSVITNYFFSKQIWKPFFKILNSIKSYKLDQHNKLSFDNTSTMEFRQLGETLELMSQRISADYENLKSFTENASHEIQTPLAIIKSKTEYLMQRGDLNEKISAELSIIYETAGRISKLNQTLLLLSKIDNHKFIAGEKIDFRAILLSKLSHLEELFAVKDLLVKTDIGECNVLFNTELAEILIVNLLSNAIRHTPENGSVLVELNTKQFTVSNTGSALKGDPDKIFQRFYKENPAASSNGLGLAIVQQIAIVNGHSVKYNYEKQMHNFIYEFNI